MKQWQVTPKPKIILFLAGGHSRPVPLLRTVSEEWGYVRGKDAVHSRKKDGIHRLSSFLGSLKGAEGMNCYNKLGDFYIV